jgi:adenosine deaminase
VISTHSVVPISSPTADSISSTELNVRMGLLGWQDGVVPDDIAELISLDPDLVRRAPKVLLHDHLDGGLRPATIVDLAQEIGHELPATDPASLGSWFTESADSGSLERYLETFDHTVAVMQTADQLTRVARECVDDLAEDGIVYAEVRYAPEQHLAGDLTLDEVVAAVQEGFDEGQAASGGRIVVRQLLTAMRHQARSREIAELASPGATAASPGSTSPARRRATRPPGTSTRSSTSSARTRTSRSTPARRSGCRRSGRRSSGAAPTGSGHGVRIIDDIKVADDGSVELGRLAAYVRDQRIPLEMCPFSNLQTGAAASLAEHPIGLLTRLRFRVTVNTDNRLMSGTSMTAR